MSIDYTPRTETIVILQGDDEEQLRKLRAYRDSLKPGQRKPGAVVLMTENPEGDYQDAVQAAADFANEATERGIKVVLRSLGRKAWRDLVAAHPPRDDNDGDARMGVNAETFGYAIVCACMASPVFDSDKARDDFLDSITEADYGNIEQVAWALNTGRSSDPKADLASKRTPT